MLGRKLTISIRSGDAVASSFELDGACGEILVGRSRSCGICTPPEDHSVSGKHARIFRRGRAVWIEDAGSRNGVIVDGERITKPVRLVSGSVYRLGECYLTISEQSGGGAGTKTSCHKLEFLSGDRAGELIELRAKGDSTGGAFTIGLDPGNDIVLADRIVSRRHASFSVKRGGDCFVKDLGSSNGTFVNGKRLDARERFLHHGDKISIAYFDFRFHDSRAKPIPSIRELRKKLAVLLALGALIAAGWVVYDGIRPPASSWRNRATKLAEREDFAGAFQAMTNAYSARSGHVDERALTDAAHGQLKAWRQTDETWRSIRDKMAAGKHGVVRADLERITADPGNWTWNTSTAVEKRAEADFALDLIHRIYAASDLLKERPPAKARIEAGIADIDGYLSSHAKALASTGYLKSAVENLKRMRGRMQGQKDGIDKIDSAIGLVGGENPDFTEAERILSELVEAPQTRDSEAIRTHAEMMVPICRKFMETSRFLKSELDFLTGLDFTAVRKSEATLPLPDQDACARHPVFSAARETFLRRHDTYQREAQLLAPMLRNLSDAGIAEGEIGSLLKSVCTMKTWEEALTFDCFTGRFPEPSRVDPNSVYDGLVGIECTFENLHALPKPPGRQNNVRMRFIPKAQRAKVIFEQVKTFRSVMDRPEGLAFRTGALGELYALAAKIMELRENLISSLKARRTSGMVKGQSMNREQIVAGYFAEYFADEASYADLRALESGFKTLERKVRLLNEQYENESDPEKRLKIRKEVIALGIPGSEEVRKRWVEMGE